MYRNLPVRKSQIHENFEDREFSADSKTHENQRDRVLPVESKNICPFQYVKFIKENGRYVIKSKLKKSVEREPDRVLSSVHDFNQIWQQMIDEYPNLIKCKTPYNKYLSYLAEERESDPNRKKNGIVIHDQIDTIDKGTPKSIPATSHDLRRLHLGIHKAQQEITRLSGKLLSEKKLGR